MEYWTTFSLKIHSNQKYKIRMEFGHSLGNVEKSSMILLESPSWAGFNECDLEIFKRTMWDILSFEYFLLLKFN
jgi:hypothetical protein